MGVVFVDTETTGLDPRRHEIWEIALIEENGIEHLWYPSLSNLNQADLIALNIGQFFERHPRVYQNNADIVDELLYLTVGQHLVGAIPSFDEERLRNLIWKMNKCPAWHYHLIDVEALAVGFLNGMDRALQDRVVSGDPPSPPWYRTPPWKSDDVFNALGIDRDRPEFAKHTAMGDARLVREVYNLVMGTKF